MLCHKHINPKREKEAGPMGSWLDLEQKREKRFFYEEEGRDAPSFLYSFFVCFLKKIELIKRR